MSQTPGMAGRVLRVVPMFGRLARGLKRCLVMPREVRRTSDGVDAGRAELRILGQQLQAGLIALGEEMRQIGVAGRATVERSGIQAHEKLVALADEIQRLRDHHAECFGLFTDRERTATALGWSGPDAAPPEPFQPDPSRYRERHAALGADIRIRLSAAPQATPDYLEICPYLAAGVDVVADPRRLPFPCGTLAEVVCHHLLDRFPRTDVREMLIHYWRSLLRPDGVLRIVTLNWRTLAARVGAGELSLEAFRSEIAETTGPGGRRVLYDRESLCELLRSAGLTEIEMVADDRCQGVRSELEVVVRA